MHTRNHAFAPHHHEQVARALIEAKADLEKQSKIGNTALIIACQNGHEPCARALIEAGSEIDNGEEDGRSLHAGLPPANPGTVKYAINGWIRSEDRTSWGSMF